MKITILKRGNLFRGTHLYGLSRDEHEIGQLVDSGDGAEVQIDLDGRSYRIERTRTGIATGRFAGIRNFLNRNATGEFRLEDAARKVLATARQPMLFEFYVTAGSMTLNVPRGRGQKIAKLSVLNETGEVLGTLTQGPWKITGRTDWCSSLPDSVDPVLEAFLLWLYVMCARRAENSSPPT